MRALLLLLVATPLLAQEPAPPAPGKEFRVYVGLWTSHLRRIRTGIDNNWLLGVGYNGLYGATFINSYGTRAFALGLERQLARTADGNVERGLSYRVGLVTGYDQRLNRLAAKSPVVPLAQLVGSVDVGRGRMELAWAGLVASLGPSVRP